MALMADLVTVAILARDTGGRVSYSEDNWNKHGQWKWNIVHLMIPTQQKTQPSLHYDSVRLRPVYTQIQMRVHFKKKKYFFLEKLRVFSVFSHTILAVCRWSANRRFHYARLRFLSGQEHLFPHRVGTFSIRSFPFHFVPNENNFNKASQKTANTHTLQQKCKPHFELPENSVPRLHKVQYRNQHYGSERSQDIYVPQKTQNWAHSWLENKWTTYV